MYQAIGIVASTSGFMSLYKSTLNSYSFGSPALNTMDKEDDRSTDG